MNTLDAHVAAAFKSLADETGFPARHVSDGSLEIRGSAASIRVRSRVDRIEGVFVMIGKYAEDRYIEYGLPYLVQYKGGSQAEYSASMGNDLQALTQLVKQYALAYLIDTANDFPAFEKFAVQKISEHVPPTPAIKANKWIRPEW